MKLEILIHRQVNGTRHAIACLGILLLSLSGVSSFQIPHKSHLQKDHYSTNHELLPFSTLSNTFGPSNKPSLPRSRISLKSSNNPDDTTSRKASISITTNIDTLNNSPTAILDSILSLITSDIGSIILGLVGIAISLFNRLTSIDYEASAIATNAADAMGQQSRIDLLAVFASGAVLLNGISKLDVTSALAESVVLEGMNVDPTFVNGGGSSMLKGLVGDEDRLAVDAELTWAMTSVLESTPAQSAVLLEYQPAGSQWVPIVHAGILPLEESLRISLPKGLGTPILNRFLKDGGVKKESYLPTLQALPGKVEFTYLPPNAQEALILPIDVQSFDQDSSIKVALVLGSDTAKNFSPKDVAWCQVLSSRIGDIVASRI